MSRPGPPSRHPRLPLRGVPAHISPPIRVGSSGCQGSRTQIATASLNEPVSNRTSNLYCPPMPPIIAPGEWWTVQRPTQVLPAIKGLLPLGGAKAEARHMMNNSGTANL